MQQPLKGRCPFILCDEMVQPREISYVLAKPRSMNIIVALSIVADKHVTLFHGGHYAATTAIYEVAQDLAQAVIDRKIRCQYDFPSRKYNQFCPRALLIPVGFGDG